MKQQTILVPVDMEEMSLYAIEQSHNLARLTGSSITLLYVHQPSGHLTRFFNAEQSKLFIATISSKLEEMANESARKSSLTVNSEVRTGQIAKTIADTAKELNARFIIMGTFSKENDSDPEKAQLGAHASRVIRIAECPVVTISRKHQYEGCRSILVPLDLTKETRQKVQKAIELARLFNAKVHVVSAYWSKGNEQIHKRLDHQIKQVLSILRKEKVDCVGEILESDKENKTHVPILLKYINEHKDIDLVMIMTQQEVGIVEYFVGSHAQEMVRKSPVPVMSVVPRDLGERTFISI